MMAKILVCGLINIETTLQVESFPIHYKPVNFPFFGVHTTISGVGYNIAKALTALGNEVCFLSIVGKDWYGEQVHRQIIKDGMINAFILDELPETAQSIILYDCKGTREIFVDLKDIQDRTYPIDVFLKAADGCQVCVLCNINFARPLLSLAKATGKIVATDVHTISDLEDLYNRDFMKAADILFMSDESLPVSPEDWINQVVRKYSPIVTVVGMGKMGSIMKEKGNSNVESFPAYTTRPVVNTIGAGDALFSAFIHGYAHTLAPGEALRQASVFASFKIGEKSAAEGFLDDQQLKTLYNSIVPSQSNLPER
jgi:acarbose 7IV-phosphotransferase